MKDDKIFCEGLIENDIEKLLAATKSDLHNHSTKGCRKSWLEERIGRQLAETPDRFDGLEGMQTWFTNEIKPFCRGREGIVLRWEGAFAEAKRNNIQRLSMNFGTAEIDLVGGVDAFVSIVEGFRKTYCAETVFEPELTYASSCDVAEEAGRIDQYLSGGYFKSIDVCGGENIQPFEVFQPLYRKAEKYHLIKRMHVGETGPAEDVMRAVEMLGLDEIHHGIRVAESEKVMRFLADQKIQLNVCPSSNVMLGYARNYKEHPIKLLYEYGVRVTINTDDLLIFDSSIENEYRLLYQAGVLSTNQLDEIRRIGLLMKRS
ncbi:MAG: adenosine deaminase [Lachnospiraceae bacterium]|nr:adenosine deaminase [Lachnospiraceae bacterium]